MKLYTELEVNELCRALRDIAQWDDSLEEDWEDQGSRATNALKHFNKSNPIELPNEIEYLKKSEELLSLDYIEGFMDGAWWVKDKIQGGNK